MASRRYRHLLPPGRGDEIATDLNLPVEAWRGMVADFLRRRPSDGRTLVVVIDGLDEAADWEAGADLFPRRPPEGVRIVVSARLTATTPDHETWLDQLGWTRGVARPITLQPLSRNGVREVVVSMGFPLTELGTKVDVIQELHRLSGGDPLMVRLYVDELWAQGAEVIRLVPEDLAAIRPGLAGYFDRWWREQKVLWGQAAPLKERGVRAVLNLLAAAFGPLAREDLLGLAPEEADLTTWTLDDALQPLRRFIIEEPAGLVFSHPRFAQYLIGELTPGERTALDEQFMAWSAAVRRNLEEDSLSPVDTPRYVVLYTGAHLERLGSNADEMCALLTPLWRQAWESSDAGMAGFGNDVDRAFRIVRQERRKDLAMFCFLVKASIRSISHRIPAALVRRLLEQSVWRPKQAIAYARTMATFPEHVELLAVASQCVDRKERTALLEEARAAAALEGRDRARAFLALMRVGDPAITFIAHGGYRWEDLWLAAVKDLVETGRLEEAEALCAFEPIAISLVFTRWLIGSRQFEALRRLLKRRSTVAIDAETEWQLLLLEGRFHVRTGLPHERIEAARTDLLAGRPVRLTTLDLHWLYRLFDCWDFSGVIAEFAYRFAQAMPPAMRDVLARMLQQSSPRQARRAILLAPEGERDRQVRTSLAGARGIELRTIIEELVPILRGELLELAVARLAVQGGLKSEDCRNLVGQLVVRDAAALRRAVAKLDESDEKLMLLCAVADADEEGRPDLVRRIHAALTRRTPAEIFESYHLDMVARHLDGTVLRAIVGALSRLSDEPDVELARFLVTPERFPVPPPHVAGEEPGLLAACLSSENTPAVLRWMIESAPLRQPALLDLMIATRLSGDTAVAFREILWKRIQTVLPTVIEAIPWMQNAPAPRWRAEVPQEVRTMLWSSSLAAYGNYLIARPLLEHDSAASTMVRDTIRSYGIGWIGQLPFRHLTDFLSFGERMEILSSSPSPHAILALGPHVERVRMHELVEQLSLKATPAQLCAMLPFMDSFQQEAVVRELLSGAHIQATAPLIRDVLLGLWVEASPQQLRSMQDALTAALTPSEILRITRALSPRPETAMLIAGIHRCAPLPSEVLAQVLDILLDVSRPVTRRAALRDAAVLMSLLRSGAEQGDTDRYLAAIDRAVDIFP